MEECEQKCVEDFGEDEWRKMRNGKRSYRSARMSRGRSWRELIPHLQPLDIEDTEEMRQALDEETQQELKKEPKKTP